MKTEWILKDGLWCREFPGGWLRVREERHPESGWWGFVGTSAKLGFEFGAHGRDNADEWAEQMVADLNIKGGAA